MLVDDAAVAVVGVLVDAQVGHDHDVVADVAAQVAQRQLHDAVGIEGADCRSASFVAGTPNRITARTPRAASSRDLLAQRLAGVLHDTRQRRDRLGLVDALADEQRCDQVVDPEV